MKWWPNHFLQRGTQFSDFWKNYFNSGKRNMLFVMGKGFDSRMNYGISQMLEINSDCDLTCMVVNLLEGEFSPSQAFAEDAERNFSQLNKILGKRNNLMQFDLQMMEGSRRVGGRKAALLFADHNILKPYTDIVVDISAMPRNVYFPLIKQILNLLDSDENKIMKNLHVIVAEEFSLDIKISAKELDENASYMFSFSGSMELEALAETPVIWFPILGEGKQEQLNIIYKFLKNNVRNLEIEVCPVIPFPARNPRRVDDLIIQYHLFFENHEVEQRNIIFADEQNPFDVYRQIRDAGIHYKEALEPLSGCRKVITATSSKLLSLGALMAAEEGDMAVAYVGAQGYTLNKTESKDNPEVGFELFEVWIAGEPYC